MILSDPKTISVGRRDALAFPAGEYAYVGSALGGLEARLRRHWRNKKRLHWHIDYLLREASIEKVILAQTCERIECHLARFFSERFSFIPRFGASDCQCCSHLFWSPDQEDLVRATEVAFHASGVKPEILTHSVKKSLTCGRNSH
jgi:Uri superfamily endonuclease